jgi:hypothetical protein
MRAYIYQADILCESCAQRVMDDLRARGLEPEDDLLKEDSGSWPVGPFPDGGESRIARNTAGVVACSSKTPLRPRGNSTLGAVRRRGKSQKSGSTSTVTCSER